ncbi:cell division protein FtsB [Pasteurellaceae bacterium HPA106]|uniref:cell division protein FtsB n=1 Tax=Spirabiliibacterium pneumoniae TaxID=221400 RepID=UPI001AAC4BD2|nr:cell division protein FtsB [Spirabiliibacterium pneumoniae]MBE2897150.1 cell division protein FtsB [Spirabiliibacterium pneumoniae]
MRVLILILIALAALFQYSFWFGKNGYVQHNAVEQEIAAREQENQQLMQRNQLIMAEIKDLKEGVEAIEERARLEHDMIKPNEVFYRLVKSDEYQ